VRKSCHSVLCVVLVLVVHSFAGLMESDSGHDGELMDENGVVT
jgi:hypothetical protein